MHAGARGNYCKFPDTFHEVIATSIAQARSGNQKQGRTDKYSHSSSRFRSGCCCGGGSGGGSKGASGTGSCKGVMVMMVGVASSSLSAATVYWW